MSWGNRIRGNPQSVQKLLDENAQLIQAIVDYQNKGKAAECIQYQQLLHKNLMYLASLADSTQNIQAMIPPAPTPTGVPSTTPVSGTMGVPSGNVPVNIQDRKILPGTSMDQGSTAIPNMTSQVISSAGSPMTSTMHTAPQSMTTVQVDGTGNTPKTNMVGMLV
ncbi:calcium-responsive transactivator-like [Dendronephthya gigantea]|uniref:calcium-responsive transactivator-like n=1 Tax=Dendronephthya gigantea TaxID=151771 RepID=UPI0010696A5C|nr:calcium-responsive transactivator-like [Dendronephthya gigantea]